ncbi:MAG: hypothetical protein AB7R90_11590 [Reyranellaceae bacterium]
MPRSTRWILTAAIVAAVMALLASAVILDEETEFGSPTYALFSALIGVNLGPLLLAAGGLALFHGTRPHNRKLVPLALAAIALGAFMTWLFFFELETIELPNIGLY